MSIDNIKLYLKNKEKKTVKNKLNCTINVIKDIENKNKK